jgi:hypothetical protein
MLSLYISGSMKLAGPLTDNAGGAVLLDVADEAEAKAIVAQDPAVKSGIFVYELHPWELKPWDEYSKKRQHSSAETPAPQSSPEALVSDLYKQKTSPFFQTKDHGLVDKYFSEGLAQLIWKDAVSSKGEVGALDFDPHYDAQDTDIKKFSLRKSNSGKDSAEVIVLFENMGHKTEITYCLVLTKMCWKISNIKYADGRNLLDLLRGKLFFA